MTHPELALLLCFLSFVGLFLHLRWDRVGWSRVGALPLTDATEVSRERA